MRARPLASVLLLAWVAAGPAAAEDRARPRIGKVGLKAIQVFPDTHQVLMFDKDSGKHVVVSEGDRIGKYEVIEVGDAEVIVRLGTRDLVLLVEAPTPGATAPVAAPAGRDLLDPYAVVPIGGPGPLDPYAAAPAGAPASTPAPGPIREVLAPVAQRVGTPGGAAPVDPYALPKAIPAPSTPSVVTPPPPAPPPTTTAPVAPAVEAIRIESLTIKRGALTGALADFDKLSKDIGFVRTGDGVRLTTIRAGSYFHGLGLRSGDLVTAIDGAPLRTLDDAAGAYARLGGAKTLTIAIDRAGARGTLRFALK